MPLVNSFKIGCDPEFAVLNSKGLSFRFRGTLYPKTTCIGADGPLLELRPRADVSAYEIMKRLREGILDPRIKDWKFKAGGIVDTDQDDPDSDADDTQEPIGGHIHFEKRYWRSLNEKTCKELNCERFFHHCLTFDHPIVKALDALTALYVHVELLPSKEMAARCTLGDYGNDCDAVRDSRMSIEYRRMCSWLYHPRITYIVLTTAKLAAVNPKLAEEKLKGVTDFKVIKNFVKGFASADDDARRVSEKLLVYPLKRIKADHTRHFRPLWERWRPE